MSVASWAYNAWDLEVTGPCIAWWHWVKAWCEYYWHTACTCVYGERYCCPFMNYFLESSCWINITIDCALEKVLLWQCVFLGNIRECLQYCFVDTSMLCCGIPLFVHLYTFGKADKFSNSHKIKDILIIVCTLITTPILQDRQTVESVETIMASWTAIRMFSIVEIESGLQLTSTLALQLS